MHLSHIKSFPSAGQGLAVHSFRLFPFRYVSAMYFIEFWLFLGGNTAPFLSTPFISHLMPAHKPLSCPSVLHLTAMLPTTGSAASSRKPYLTSVAKRFFYKVTGIPDPPTHITGRAVRYAHSSAFFGTQPASPSACSKKALSCHKCQARPEATFF